MKKIIISLGVIGVVAAVVIGVTSAFYGDTETSIGNTFTAGSIDLKIDLQCDDPSGCDFSLRDLNNEDFFDACDIKPGDSGEVTISWHVYDNNAWARVRLADVYNYENGCTEPEGDEDSTCDNPGNGQGELAENLNFTIWLDEGSVDGWQCPENEPSCTADPQEGNNILDRDAGEPTIYDGPASNLMNGWFVFPEEIIGSETYYFGVRWTIPPETGNIIQTDSLIGSIVMQVVQSRNNPDKVF